MHKAPGRRIQGKRTGCAGKYFIKGQAGAPGRRKRMNENPGRILQRLHRSILEPGSSIPLTTLELALPRPLLIPPASLPLQTFHTKEERPHVAGDKTAIQTETSGEVRMRLTVSCLGSKVRIERSGLLAPPLKVEGTGRESLSTRGVPLAGQMNE